MTVRERVLGFKKALSAGDVFAEYPELTRAVGYLVNFVLGLALASARVFTSSAAFGMAAVAQAGTGLGGVACLVGASAGYLIGGGFDWGIKYVAASMLVFTTAFICRELKFYERDWFMPLMTSIITGSTQFLNSYSPILVVPTSVLLMTETVLSGGAAYFFKLALSPPKYDSEAAETARAISLLILLSCTLMAMSELNIMGVMSIGRFAAVLTVMTVSFKGSLTSGAAAGAALGLAMDISAGGAPFFTMAFSFSGLLSGVFQKHGKPTFLISYTLANLVSVLWTWNTAMRIEILYEVFAASVIFMILPSSLLNYIGGVFRSAKTGEGEAGLRRYSANRIRQLGTAFGDLYDTVRRGMERETNDNEIATVYDRAADSVCKTCKRKSECWERGYLDTINAMNDATEPMMKKGFLAKTDLPGHFVEHCEQPQDFIAAVNAELRGLMYRRQYRARVAENRAAAYGQYADMVSIMESIAGELDSAAGPDHLGERRLLRFLQNMDIDAEASVFRERSGRLRAVIESARLYKLTNEPDYLDKLSGVLGVRLCRPADDTRRRAASS